MKNKLSTGVVHGRFQPFHIGHLDYLLKAKSKCDHIIIGISNPAPNLMRENQADLNRTKPQSNPLTYFERTVIIKAALKENGIYDNQYTIVPFPINFPELIRHYVPSEATYFLTVFDDWGRTKVKTLEGLGLKVDVIYEKPLVEKKVSATMIRNLMVSGKRWEKYVCDSVANTIKQFGFDQKIIQQFT